MQTLGVEFIHVQYTYEVVFGYRGRQSPKDVYLASMSDFILSIMALD